MEYILKICSREQLAGKISLIEEYIGADADSFIEEILEAFPAHQVISYYKLAAEYATKNTISLLGADPHIEIDPSAEALVIDGWSNRENCLLKDRIVLVDRNNTKTLEIPFENRSIFIIDRSVTKSDYRTVYKAFVLLRMQPLKICTLNTHSLSITIREKSKEIELLYNYTEPKKYTICT